MSPASLAAFALASTVLAVTPGPGVVYILTAPASLVDNDLCRHLDAAAHALLEPLLGRRRFAPGQPIVHRGEPANDIFLIDRRTRSADVTASGEVTCRLLTAEAFDLLGRQHAQVKIVQLQNMLRSAHQIVSRLSDEVAALGN